MSWLLLRLVISMHGLNMQHISCLCPIHISETTLFNACFFWVFTQAYISREWHQILENKRYKTHNPLPLIDCVQ